MVAGGALPVLSILAGDQQKEGRIVFGPVGSAKAREETGRRNSEHEHSSAPLGAAAVKHAKREGNNHERSKERRSRPADEHFGTEIKLELPFLLTWNFLPDHPRHIDEIPGAKI